MIETTLQTQTGPGMDREAKIRELAYVKWVAAGQPDGDGLQFWCAAEREIAERDPHAVDEPRAETEQAEENASVDE